MNILNISTDKTTKKIIIGKLFLNESAAIKAQINLIRPVIQKKRESPILKPSAAELDTIKNIMRVESIKLTSVKIRLCVAYPSNIPPITVFKITKIKPSSIIPAFIFIY